MDPYKHLRVKGEHIAELIQKLKIPGNEFKSKVAVITGGARGLGKELVLGLGSLGVTVYFIDKRKQEGDLLLKESNDLGLAVEFINDDITHFEAMRLLLDSILTKHGTIDFLINNAVEFITKDIDQLSIEEWKYSHDTNTTAPLLFVKQLLPYMLENSFSVIVNLIAVEGMAHASAMSSSKASCRSFTISLASELAKHKNITVFGYAPGLVDTPLMFENFPEYCKKLNYDFTDYVLNITNNPGYEGLIPSSHSAASLIWYMSKGRENHGLICTPYLALQQAGIINFKEEYIQNNIGKHDNINQANQYIVEINKYQKAIENKINVRTKQLQKEKVRSAELLYDLQKHSEEQEILNSEKTTLLKEIHHRVKNNMQIISSLLRIQSNNSNDETSNLLAQSQSRIMAMATVHDILYKSSNFSKINFDNYLKELCHYLRQTIEENKNIDFKISAKDIVLSLNCSISLGLIVNEILTNSLKHAFPDNKSGDIYIEFDKANAEYYEFRIGDNGIGLNPTKSKPDGLGRELIQDLIKQLQGVVCHDVSADTGTHYSIQFKDIEVN